MRAKEQQALAALQRQGRGVDSGTLAPLISLLVQVCFPRRRAVRMISRSYAKLQT